VVGLAAVGWPRVENDLAVDASSFGIPYTDKKVKPRYYLCSDFFNSYLLD
jgi:hypothetical protein